MKKWKQTKLYLICVSLILIMAILIGLNHHSAKAFDLNWLLANNESVSQEEQLTEEDLATLQEVYQQIQGGYIEDIDKKTLLEGALKGMVEATGDPYSDFLNNEESSDMSEDLSGSFTGIGIQIMNQDDQITVISAIEDTPASRAGIQPNDILMKADNHELRGLTAQEVVELIRGEKGSQVHLTIQRGEKTFEIDVERDEIPVHSVTGEIKNDSLGVVKISQFNTTTADELKGTVEDLREKGAEAFVFDLRYNPGGLMDQALKVANMFLKDQDIIMQVQDKQSDYPTSYVANNKTYGDFKINEPYLILMNEGSASAAEILAAAVKENTNASVVGEKSFGKGTVQTVFSKSDFGELKLTIAKWLTPTGEWIHDKGLEPDQEISAPPIQKAVLFNGDQDLSLGQDNELTSNLVDVLSGLGYKIESDGEFNQSVQDALKKFQKDHDKKATGILDKESQMTLNQAAQEYLQTHDDQLDEAIRLLEDQLSEDQAA